jgi:hypothetical protein
MSRQISTGGPGWDSDMDADRDPDWDSGWDWNRNWDYSSAIRRTS